MLSKSRSAFITFLALLQVALLPATQVLHVACQHSHDNGSVAIVSVCDAINAGWSWCTSSRCCGHGSKCATAGNDQSSDSGPVNPSHDEDSCPVCQAVLAAGIATTTTAELTETEPFGALMVVDSFTFYSTPRYGVLSRGPPTTLPG